MLEQKVISFLLIHLIVAFSHPQQGFLKNQYQELNSKIDELNFVNQTALNQRMLFQLITSSINEEAKQDLCPYPGFYGDYCVGLEGQQENLNLYKEIRMKRQNAQQNAETDRFQMICTDCIPNIYNSPNGQILQCNCPAF
ncbi:hypothetical protein ABPG74_005386 [Tetrahymena malaccensis]